MGKSIVKTVFTLKSCVGFVLFIRSSGFFSLVRHGVFTKVLVHLQSNRKKIAMENEP